MFSIVLPNSSEIWFFRDCLYFMGKDHVFFGKKFWYESAGGFPFLFELLSTFWGSCINTKNEFMVLVSLGEGV
jgi:hypothetical protein